MYYICGYVEKKIITRYNRILNIIIAVLTNIVSFKNNGSLISASPNVFKITSETKNYLLLLTDNLKKLNTQNLDLKIIYFCNKKFFLEKNIFRFIIPHKMLLISLLFKKYPSIRLHSYGKMYSTKILSPLSNRHKLTKHILFMNQ
ncbi:Uncharacterized protein FWK35_00015721 [Aphis craccivora]|uniref:Uncharacterized protein n=1 Tax=Aphis craccivora TaxID=307492 RepID=A0A6G0YN28_APHCR|nr:Uncharacterized protein FWK35_00015721 [Aphis craccivora]